MTNLDPKTYAVWEADRDLANRVIAFLNGRGEKLTQPSFFNKILNAWVDAKGIKRATLYPENPVNYNIPSTQVQVMEDRLHDK